MIPGEEEKNGAEKYFTPINDIVTLTGEEARGLAGVFAAQNSYSAGERIRLRPEAVREYLKNKGVDYSFKTIAHVNLRGGIGKTTCAITTATRAVQYGFNTCVLDLDSQGSASLAFDRMPESDDPIFLDVWQKPGEMLMGSLKQVAEGLYLLPSSLENGLLDTTLTNPSWQKSAVRGVCGELKANGFHLVLIDCPPSLGAGVISSICAADIVVIPVGSDPFSFKGLELALNEISTIRETFGLPAPEIRVLFSRFDRREKMSFSALDMLREKYGDYLVPVVIRTSTEFSKALERRETVFASAVKSVARDDYDRHVRHLLGLTRIFKDREVESDHGD